MLLSAPVLEVLEAVSVFRSGKKKPTKNNMNYILTELLNITLGLLSNFVFSDPTTMSSGFASMLCGNKTQQYDVLIDVRLMSACLPACQII